VGKSTLLNALCNESRSIVSPIAATTRDSIDTITCHQDKEYCFIDTAGLRRKKKEKNVVEKFSCIRTKEAIERAQVCLLVIDALDGMTVEEKKIAQLIEEEKKCCIVVVNKWDLVKGFRMEHCFQGLDAENFFLSGCPKLIISAKTKRNVTKIFDLIDRQLERYSSRMTTGQLNKFLTSAMQYYHPPVIGGKRLRIYYMTQVEKSPPHFVLFVNNPLLLDLQYKRYLLNALKDAFKLHGVPILLTLRKKESGEIRRKSTLAYDRDLPNFSFVDLSV
jgi:GTP-binding protein